MERMKGGPGVADGDKLQALLDDLRKGGKKGLGKGRSGKRESKS